MAQSEMKLVIAVKPVWYEIGGEQAVGSRFEMRASDVARHVKAGLVVETKIKPSSETTEEDIETLPLEVLRSKWTISTKPADYMKKFPNGPNAALAMQLLELEQEALEAEEAAATPPAAPEVAPISTQSIATPE